MTVNPLDALSALQAQLPTTGALNGANPNAFNGAMGGALNANPPAGAISTDLTAPMSEGFGVASAPTAGGANPSTWGHMVQQMVMDVNAKQADAAQKVSDVLQGGPTPVHEAMVASEEASLSMEFLGEMRNKIVDAYNQVMQMQV